MQTDVPAALGIWAFLASPFARNSDKRSSGQDLSARDDDRIVGAGGVKKVYTPPLFRQRSLGVSKVACALSGSTGVLVHGRGTWGLRLPRLSLV